MNDATRRRLKRGGAVALAGTLGAALVVILGVVPIAASSGHWDVTAAILHFAMGRSVATYSIGIEGPDLDDPRLVVMGAGHYESGCRMCHGAPGHRMPRVPAAMTPHPPPLDERLREYDDAELFYIVRHGVKFTGMPAWPSPHRKDEVWAMVAFLRAFRSLDGAGYDALVHGDHHEPADGAPEVVSRACARCHGADGLGRGEGAFPKIAGQKADYLRGSLEAYARGRRHSGIMEPIAAALGPEELDAAVRWYATRRPFFHDAGGGGGNLAGATIAEHGIPADLVAPCGECHGPKSEPEHPVYPRLAGQYQPYLAQQLELFRSGHRGGTPYANVMRNAAAHALDDEQIRAVSRYYASGAREIR